MAIVLAQGAAAGAAESTVSEGCGFLNSPTFDATYNNQTFNPAMSFLSGETTTFTATSTSSSNIPTVSVIALIVDDGVNPPVFVSTPFLPPVPSATLNYTFPADTSATVTWLVGYDPGSGFQQWLAYSPAWEVSCAAGPPVPQVAALSPAHLWIGLKNSDDQGTRFDMKVELLKNGTPVASGLTRCITGVTRNPALATEAVVPFDAFAPVALASDDVLSLRVSTRIGTNPDGTKCRGGHNNATGVRLYYDSTGQPSRLDATIEPSPSEDLYLHSDGGPCPGGGGDSPGVTTRVLDPTAPTATSPKCKDSGPVNFNGKNLFITIGTWQVLCAPGHGIGRPAPTGDMVAWWTLDETQGNVVFDLRGSGANNGTPRPANIAASGGPISITGSYVGNSLVFFSDRHVEVPNPSKNLDFSTGSFSIDAWVRIQFLPAGSQLPIVHKLAANVNVGYSLYIGAIGSSGNFRLKLQIGATPYDGPVIPAAYSGTYVFVAATRRAITPTDSVVNLYVGLPNSPLTGVIVPTFNTPVPNASSNDSLRIGSWPGTNQGIIAIDEVEIFKRELSPGELDNIYQTKSNGKCKGGVQPD